MGEKDVSQKILEGKNDVFANFGINSILTDNIGDLVPPVAVFWYR